MKIGYVAMVCDLFHYGHLNFIKNAKAKCDYLIVGLHSDNDVKSYKRLPILNIEERKKVLEGCKYIDKIIINAPLIITNKFMESINADIFIYATNNIKEDKKWKKDFLHIDDSRLIKIQYTNTISTTLIIDRILSRK
tara:strand:+ start:314 stop:724 length:411 start_codon:yes stop_codon:yes gene_type:complete